MHITDGQIMIGSGGTTWTQGVALVEAGKAFATRTELHKVQIFEMEIDPVILFAILLISSFLLVCALSCAGNWLPRFFLRTNLPIFRHNSAPAAVLNIASPFRFQRWSRPMSSGDARVKMPLSPTAVVEERSLGIGHWFGGSNIQLTESSLYSTVSGVSHSPSSGSLGQMQFDNNGMGAMWSPHRSRLQSRRSASREDLMSSVADGVVKV